MTERVMISDWFSYSHWGMFRLPILLAPDWFASGVVDEMDDDLIDDWHPRECLAIDDDPGMSR